MFRNRGIDLHAQSQLPERGAKYPWCAAMSLAPAESHRESLGVGASSESAIRRIPASRTFSSRSVVGRAVAVGVNEQRNPF